MLLYYQKDIKRETITDMKKIQQSKPVMGLRVVADQLIPQAIQVDLTFQKCPIAHAAGIPLYVKRLFDEPTKKSQNYIIVRMMSQPSIGLAADNWQYNGILDEAPPVLVARTDSISFTKNDWEVLDAFQVQMLDDGPRKVKRGDFINFVKQEYKQNTSNLVLQVLYPKDSKWLVNGLIQNIELNGMIGICIGIYKNQRVGISFPKKLQKYAILPINLHQI